MICARHIYLCFLFSAGSRIAIVGPTGAGKTTLANLLMKFYEPDSGSIFIDGVNTSDMRRHYVHSLFNVVLQDSWLFNGTIRENIVFNLADIDNERVMDACIKSGLGPLIESLQKGLIPSSQTNHHYPEDRNNR